MRFKPKTVEFQSRLTLGGGLLWHYQHVERQSAETQKALWTRFCSGTPLHLSAGDFCNQIAKQGKQDSSTLIICFLIICDMVQYFNATNFQKAERDLYFTPSIIT